MNARKMRRQARHAARREGCTCTPYVAPTAGPPGTVAAAMVRHERGCVLGDRVALLNRLGQMPALVSVEGRTWRSPPQLGHRPASGPSAHVAQKVHS